MANELKMVQALFDKLTRAPKQKFPQAYSSLDAPNGRGVYVIYNHRGRPAHVGGTPRAKNGIAQRLRDHLAGRSSFTIQHLKQHPSELRGRYAFQCLVVPNSRHRALLEAYAIGQLCPAHIGHGLEK
jgi:hypothetical protein